MAITIDKVDSTHYGYYTDGDGNIYPFSVEVSEEDGEQTSLEISWDDDQPENVEEVEEQLNGMF